MGRTNNGKVLYVFVCLLYCCNAQTPKWRTQNCSVECDCTLNEKVGDIPKQVSTIWMKTEDCSGRKLRNLPNVIPSDTQVLWLDDNILSDFDAILQRVSGLRNLSTVSVSRNRISVIASNLTAPSVYEFRADGSDLTTLSPALFAIFPNLKELSLRKNTIDEISTTDCVQYSSALQLLRLDYNNIEDISWLRNCSSFQSLQLLGLGGNNLKTKRLEDRGFSALAGLVELALGDMGIIEISKNAFVGLHSLETLELDDNSLSSIPAEAISSLIKLKYLNLNGNQITRIRANSFSGLEHLHTIELTDLPDLNIIDQNAFTDLPSLDTVLLSGNRRLAFVARYAFGLCPKLATLDLHGTMIETLYGETVEDLPALRYLNLRQNPINCNCMMSWLKQWITKDYEGGQTGMTDDVVCASPPELRGSRLNDVDFDDVTCSPSVQPTFPLHITVDEGDRLVLNCRAFGNPEPEIFWFLPSGDFINNATKAQIYGMGLDEYGTLTVNDVKGGYYTCTAENNRGMASRKTLVRLNEAKPTNATGLEHTTVSTTTIASTTTIVDTSTSTLMTTIATRKQTATPFQPARLTTSIANPLTQKTDDAITDSYTEEPTVTPTRKMEMSTITTTRKEMAETSTKTPVFIPVPKIRLLQVTPTTVLLTWSSSSDFVKSFDSQDDRIMKLSFEHNDKVIYTKQVQPFSVLPNWETETPEYNISHLIPEENYKACLTMYCCSPQRENKSCTQIRTLSYYTAESHNVAIVLSILLCLVVLVLILLLAICCGQHCYKSVRHNDSSYEELEDCQTIKQETPFNDIYQPLIQDTWSGGDASKPSDRLIDTSSSMIYM